MPTSFPPARPIAEGATLGIVAPAGPFDHHAFNAGITWLRHRYQIKYCDTIFEKTGYFAGSDQRRLRELTDAIADPEIDAILCARGGYGATRLLPNLDPSQVTAANKLLIGFSDVTALHALWARAGVRSTHAPMVAALGNASAETRDRWINAIENQTEPTSHPLTPISQTNQAVTGRFFGGNLAVLGALLGTPFTPPLDDCILFIEDVGERPYRIDRMLTTLTQAGWLEKIAGLILGAFTEGEPGADGISIDDVFADHFADAKIPVLAGLPAGHISENLPLQFGKVVRIDGDQFLA